MIKVVAVLCMLADHTALFLLPDWQFLRIPGRLATPLFSWLLVQGFRKTRNVNHYLFRLLLVALLTQPLYIQLFPHNLTPNFLFTLFWGLFLLNMTKYVKSWSLLLAVPMVGLHMINVDILFICLWFSLRRTKANKFIESLPRIPMERGGQWLFYLIYPIHFALIILAQAGTGL